MKRKIKIILTDLDNTLLRSDKTISDYSIDIIKRCREQKILFGIATARAKTEAGDIIEKLKPDIIISSGGAIVDYKGKNLYNRMIPKEITNCLLADCMECKDISDITIYTGDVYYWNYEDRSLLPKEYSHAVYNDYKKPLNKATYKFTVKTSDINSAMRIVKKYKQLSLLQFRGEPWARIAHKDATKEYATRALAESLKIGIRYIAAFGDDYNDIKMIKLCGMGIAVENAIDEVKRISDSICKSNNEDGVANFIEEYILQ